MTGLRIVLRTDGVHFDGSHDRISLKGAVSLGGSENGVKEAGILIQHFPETRRATPSERHIDSGSFRANRRWNHLPHSCRKSTPQFGSRKQLPEFGITSPLLHPASRASPVLSLFPPVVSRFSPKPDPNPQATFPADIRSRLEGDRSEAAPVPF